jgi:translation initiation factor 1
MIHIPDSIFPQDTNGRPVCPKCKKLLAACTCLGSPPVMQQWPKFTPKVRLDTSGRKGKVVTMIEGLPRNEKYLKDLAKHLKSKTGSGGTFYFAESGGTIEIQGDHQQIITQILIDQQKG